LTKSSILCSVDKGLLLSLVVVLAACMAWREVRRACMDEPPCINAAEEEEEKEDETNALGLRPATKTLLLPLLLLPKRLLAVRTALAEAAARVLLVGWRRSILLNR